MNWCHKLALNVAAASAAFTLSAAVAARSVPLFPSASDGFRQGFARIINHSPVAGEVRIKAIDDVGRTAAPVALAIGAGVTVHLNSGDLERGNAAKGLPGGVGVGTGAWRLAFESDLDIEALGYVRTADGFVTAMHDLADSAAGVHHVPTFNPASNYNQVSRLRIVNFGGRTAQVTIRGTDDRGRSPGSAVELSIPPGAARALDAQQLESGGDHGPGLGDGVGKWRLAVESAQPLEVMSLLQSPTGHLSNLSTAPAHERDGVHSVPFLPAAGGARQGFLRVINRSGRAGQVRIRAFDDSDWDHDPITLSLEAKAAVHFNSGDLESGSPQKGLSGGVGQGRGHWRLELASDLDIEVLAYIRTAQGFLAAMHDVAPSIGVRHRVAFFNPGSNYRQESQLRIVNPGGQPAAVAISGIDGAGAASAGEVRFTVPAGQARTVSARELESGADGLQGSLGDGSGKWQLNVRSERPIQVLSLLASPTGHLANLSTAPGRGAGGTAAEVFDALVAGPVVEAKCLNCHVPGGESGGTRLVFAPTSEAGHRATNLEAIRDFVGTVDAGAALILEKIQGIGHGGGQQVPAGSPDFGNLARLLDRLEWEAAQPAPSPEPQVVLCADAACDRDALVALYKSAGGENWTSSANWLSDEPLEKWHGVYTNGDGRVAHLWLQSNGLKGKLPRALGGLTQLVELYLDLNDLSGGLPPVGGLGSLVSLGLSGNDLSGPIPRALGNLPNLVDLHLTSNRLSGSIPPELGRLGDLRYLRLAANDLSGPIPAQLASLARLAVFNAGGNRLSGPIPPELGSLGELTELLLWQNNLSGPVPPELGNLAKLTVLHLASNDLSGPLPAALAELPLRVFSWGGNDRLCMPDTPAFADLVSNLELLHTSGDYCGSKDRAALDAFFLSAGGSGWKKSEGWPGGAPGSRHGVVTDQMGRVTAIDLADNGLAGELPDELGDLEKLGELRLGGNPDLAGRLPYTLPRLGALKEIRYAGTALCVPTEAYLREWLDGVPVHEGTGADCEPAPNREVLAGLYEQTKGDGWFNSENWLTDRPLREWHGVEADGQGRVTKLDLSHNNLLGAIPPVIASLGNLIELNLSANDLSGGPIPPELAGLAKLETLNLSGIHVAGGVPPEIGDLAQLKTLKLSGNRLAGPIPLALGGLTQLRLLQLDDNALSGALPVELGDANRLEEIHLAKNDLSGLLPAALTELRELRILDLSGNGFSGAIPAELGGFARLEYLNLSFNDLDGSLPAALGRVDSLTHLYLANNRFSGPVPPEIGNLSGLVALALTGNAELAGALPVGFAGLGEMSYLWAARTQLCAPADAALTAWLDGLLTRRVRECGTEPQGAYLTQAVQSRELPIALLAGEEALLRVFPTARRSNSASIPKVRATFYRDGSVVHSVDIDSKPGPVPTTVDEGALAMSANATVPADVVQPGLEMAIEIDPDGALDAGLGVASRIPRTGRMAVKVRTMPVFDVTFIPFLWESDPDSSVVDLVAEMEADPMGHPKLHLTRTVLPVGELKVTAHAAVWSDSNKAIDLIRQVQLIRTMEGGSGYYMGLLSGESSGASGIGNIGQRTAYSVTSASVIAHEFGHNLSLQHTPCGNPLGIEPAFPYPDGSSGAWGYDFGAQSLVSPQDYKDLMSYCSPYWASDFGFDKALRYRLHSEGLLREDTASSPTRSLIVWGGVESGAPFLEPALVAQAPSALPREEGPWTVTGADADGAELFTLRFRMPVAGDANGDSGFVFALPVEAEWEGELASMEISGPDGRFVLDGEAERPLAVVRDVATGEVTRIARDPAALERMGAAARGRADGPVVFSRGMPDRGAWW